MDAQWIFGWLVRARPLFLGLSCPPPSVRPSVPAGLSVYAACNMRKKYDTLVNKKCNKEELALSWKERYLERRGWCNNSAPLLCYTLIALFKLNGGIP